MPRFYKLPKLWKKSWNFKVYKVLISTFLYLLVNQFFINFFIYFFFTYIKISKDLSAKYYQDNKQRLQKNAPEKYQSLSKEEKEKSNTMVVNNIKIFLKMKKI